VNTHIDARTTSYADIGLVRASLAYLGVRHIRDDALEGGIPFDVSRYQNLMSMGIGLDLASGEGDNVDPQQVIAAAQALAETRNNRLELIEGNNEIDEKRHPVNFGGMKSDAAEGYYLPAILAQKYLFDHVHSNGTLKSIPVLTFTFAHADRSGAVGNVTDGADYADVHAYAVNGTPPNKVIAKLVCMTQNVPGKPIIVSETGYPTMYPGSPPLKNLVDEKVQAAYLLDTLLDTFRMGVSRTYIYELLDRRSNPADSSDQAHYGVFRYDGSPKPAATGISNLLKVVGDGISTASSAPNLALQFTAQGSDVFKILLTKGGGKYDLIYWSEPKIWDATRFHIIPTNLGEVNVRFSKKISAIEIFDPMQSAAPVIRIKGREELGYNLADHPIIIEISE
jgi:hypothetical protein